jgi:large subunit ribosomal protein L5
MVSPLYTQYKTTVVPELKKKLGAKNVMQVPRVTKITLNVGYGKQLKQVALIEQIGKTLTAISGQKPVHTKTKKAIANFKTRVGMPIGAMVTIRGPRMYDFLYKLIHVVLPRVRDFRGIDPKGFDAQGNYSMGFKENIAFPEVTVESLDRIHGLQIVISTTAKNKQEGLTLLKEMGFPFRDK